MVLNLLQIKNGTNMITKYLNREGPEDHQTDWNDRKALAESMIPIVGDLYRKNNVKIYVYGKTLINKSAIEIMQAHRSAQPIEKNELSEFETLPIIEALTEFDLSLSHIDVGRMTSLYNLVPKSDCLSVKDFVGDQISELLEKPGIINPTRDVILYGFGRIGRLIARILIDKSGGGGNLCLRAIVVRKGSAKNDLIKRASLLDLDSVHGGFKGTICIDEERSVLIANGNEIKIIYADSPEEINYTEYDIRNAIVIDNTGAFKDREALSRHLRPGTSKVLLTAPADDIKNIVHGINNNIIEDSDDIICAASCTTNAISPPIKAINDKFGIVSGHIEAIHAYTNDQNLIDNYHKSDRRGRSAPLNLVITSTGAVKAVAKVLPEMEGKLSGNSIRVPTPNVSLAILNLKLEKETTTEEMDEYLRYIAYHSPLRKQVDYSNSPDAVSSDMVGSHHACIIDAKASIVNGNNVVLYCWYDNEAGYSYQVFRVLEQFSGVNYRIVPKDSSF